MKKQIVHIIILLFIVNIGISQSTTANKGKKSNNISVSKYDLILDKNTKEKIEPIKAESYGLPKIEISTKSNLYYNSYLTSSKKNKDYLSLLIAYELNPNVPEMYFELAKYYEINNNKEKKIEFCKKMENTILTSNLKEYAFNTLNSVEENGILITYGEEDTYPIWILQNLKGIRKDVKILNYDLLMNVEYRTKISKELNLKFKSEYKSSINILKDIAILNKTKPIYYSLTVSHLILKSLKNQLYNTGLAVKYSSNKMNNLEILKTNWEKKFQKNYVIQANTASNKINANYILPLYQLAKYYKLKENQIELKKVKDMLLKIGKNIKKEKEVNLLIEKL